MPRTLRSLADALRGVSLALTERRAFPEHLPHPPTACEYCGSNRLRKLGEDVTRTLEVVPFNGR